MGVPEKTRKYENETIFRVFMAKYFENLSHFRTQIKGVQSPSTV